MAYIEPNTTIKLLGDMHIDNSYENTGYFPNLTAQYNYFNSKVVKTFNSQSYQRINKGVMRVYANYSDIYYCSYLMFKNSSFENKWFYAFINQIEYVNDSCVEITFEIDVVQTWYFETHFNQCFVEREHVSNDVAGEHIIPENLELGQYYAKFIKNSNSYGGIYVATTVDFIRLASGDYYIYNASATNGDDGIVGQYYMGCKIKHFTDGAVLNRWLTIINGGDGTLEDGTRTGKDEDMYKYLGNNVLPKGGKAEGIVSIYMGPSVAFLNSANSVDESLDNKADLRSNYNLFEGYVPVNNKLYSYPYSYLYCTTNDGDAIDMPLEYFSDNTPSFYIYGSSSATPSMLLVPRNYKGSPINYDEAITVSGYPQCSYNIDSYRAWLAQNQTQLKASLLTGFGEASVGALNLGMYAMPGEAHGVNKFASMGAQKMLSGASQIMQTMAKIEDHSHTPNQAKGNSTGNVTRMNTGLTSFSFYMKFIQRQYAQCIDEYFCMFGYKVNRVKMPNISSRPLYNYIKTIGCDIDGNVPSDVLEQLNSIHDNGVRYWKNLDNVGNYKDANGNLYSNK